MRVASLLVLLSVAIVFNGACVYFLSSAHVHIDFWWSNSSNVFNVPRASQAKTPHPTLVLGKPLQPTKRYLTNDVFVSVRTTSAFHDSRLSFLFLTWMQALPSSQLNIVTDGFLNDTWVELLTSQGYHVTVSDCTRTHQRGSLCCKSGIEYDLYYEAMDKYRWFCHLDDDMYLNTRSLAELLNHYNHTMPLYIGYFPLAKPFELDMYRLSFIKDAKKKSFRFATGGMYCISRPLMINIEPYFRGKSFDSTCERYKLTDDMMIGLVIEVLLGYNLTIVSSIKTHLQSLVNMKPEELASKVSVSYGGKSNRITVPNEKITAEEDYSGFLSFHCFLYPDIKWC